MVLKTKEEVKEFINSVDNVDINGLMTEVTDWKHEICEQFETPDDNIKLAMIDTFIDMIIDNCNFQ